MTERKPFSETWESFAERKIREAQSAGVFDSLPGFGRPIPGIDDPDDENWWLKQKLREDKLSLLPPVLAARLDVERTVAKIWSMKTEQEVVRSLEALNERIRNAHFSPDPGPAGGVAQVEVAAIVAEWRRRRASETA